MIYQELLYSRSLSKDYRWMIVPPKVSPESLKALNKLYNLYDKYKSIFSKASVLPLYCLNYPEMTFLVSCGKSNYKDKDGRDIYCLQGISVAHEYRRHFWFILPWILAHYDTKDTLNIWRNIDFSHADDIVRRVSGDCFFKLDQLDESIAELTKAQKPAPGKLSIHEPAYIPFNKEGLQELSHLLATACHECVDFAFGVTPEMTKMFGFKIIAETGGLSKRKNTRNVTAGSISSHTSDYSHTMAIQEPPDDPIARFDPKKKGDVYQMNIVRGSSASRILGQLLPRFLSLFKIDKKHKQSRSSGQ